MIDAAFVENRIPPSTAELWANLPQVHLVREQLEEFDGENFLEEQQFAVGNPSKQRFKFRDRRKAHIPFGELELLGQHVLRPTLLAPQFTDLRADQIELPDCGNRIAVMALTVPEHRQRIGSQSGT